MARDHDPYMRAQLAVKLEDIRQDLEYARQELDATLERGAATLRSIAQTIGDLP